MEANKPTRPTGEWFLILKDGREISFYLGTPDRNPLETNPDFDAGDSWSIDTDGIAHEGMTVDPEDDSFALVPKSLVASVEFRPYPASVGVKSLTVYNIGSKLGIVEKDGKHYEITGHDDRLAVLEGPKGVAVFCDEGVGQMLDGLDSLYKIAFREIVVFDENGRPKVRHFLPTLMTKRPIRAWIEDAPTEQVLIKDFIRSFGLRLELNFGAMLGLIRDIGLDPADYYEEGTRR